jgi:hypothetical protein
MNPRFRTYVAAAAVGLLLFGMASPALASESKSKSKAPSAKSLKSLTNSVKAAKGAKYAATYKVVSPASATSTTVSIAQDPPKSEFSSGQGQGSIIDTGTKTYYCSGGGGSGSPASCIASGSTNPFADLENLFSPASALAAFSEAKEGLGSKVLGIKAVEGSQTIAGQSTTCVTVTIKSGQVGKYCVTKQGVRAYAGSDKSYFELTHYSTSPAASLFVLPAGATTITLPGGGSLP